MARYCSRILGGGFILQMRQFFGDVPAELAHRLAQGAGQSFLIRGGLGDLLAAAPWRQQGFAALVAQCPEGGQLRGAVVHPLAMENLKGDLGGDRG